MPDDLQFVLRSEEEKDKTDILELIPRLADIDLPVHRESEHVWKDVVVMYLEWCEKRDSSLWVHVAESAGKVIGVAMTQPRDEILSHQPSVHLSILAVSREAQGLGVGSALLEAAENQAKSIGAKSMSLFVFEKNTRARSVYERAGFDGELVRYYKAL